MIGWKSLLVSPLVAMSAATVLGAQGVASRTEIVQAVRAYVDAFNQTDAGGLADMYSREPGVASVSGGQVTRGWDAIRARADSLVGSGGGTKLAVGSIDVTPLGPDAVLALTTYTLSQGTQMRERGVVTFVFEKIGGSWKIIHDNRSQLVGVGAVANSSPPVSPPTATTTATPLTPPMQPVVIAIASGGMRIEAQKYLDYAFNVPAGTCRITGRIEGISGGLLDFEAFIADGDNLRNFQTRHQYNAFWQSGRVAVTNIDATVSGPGSYHLVVSNLFSALVAKAITVNATAYCS